MNTNHNFLFTKNINEVISSIKHQQQITLKDSISDDAFEKELTLTQNSRESGRNYCFIALQGIQHNGHNYIEDAISKGTKTVLYSQDIYFQKNYPDVTFIQFTTLEEDLHNVLKGYYNNLPSHLAAITGTNGKTSTVHFAAQIVSISKGYCASIGTLGCILYENGKTTKTILLPSLTTPDIVSFYRTLNALKNLNCDYICFEASSIGIDQGRFKGIELEIAAFTNLTPDHLDYHHSIENYYKAKELLFTKYLKKDGICILNKGDFYHAKIQQSLSTEGFFGKIFFYGNIPSVDLNIPILSLFKYGYKLEIEGQNFKFNVLGEYQIENLMCALLIARSFEIINPFLSIPYLNAPHGRLEQTKQANIFIDYAHTEDALKRTCEALRPFCEGRLVVVFGCGGSRDKNKRHKMGEIASQLAQLTIITDDNPRDENPATIRQDIIKGIISGAKYLEIPDRKKAIQTAMSEISAKDILLIAGKGHENYQIIGNTREYFSDFTCVTEFILETKPQ